MSYPVYNRLTDGARGMFSLFDHPATLAAQERDLVAEVADLDENLERCVEGVSAMYPPICLGTFTVPTIQN